MYRLIFVLSLLLATAASARPVRVCFLGDSISSPLFLWSYPWPEKISRSHGGQDWGWKNKSQTSYTSVQSTVFFNNEVTQRGCTHVVFLLGTNDIGQTADSAATIYGRLHAMATTAEAQGAKVVFLAILPRGTEGTWTGEREQRRVALNALLAARSGSLFIDTDTAMREAGAASGTAWAGSTAYNLNDRRVNGDELYIVTTAGTSAASGGPSGTGTAISDGVGALVWTFLPRLSIAYGGNYDGVHPNTTGQDAIAAFVEAEILAAGGWEALVP